jgi:cell division septation protein DedD
VIHSSRAPLGRLAFVFLTALLGADCRNQPAPPPHPSASEAVKKEPASKLIAVPPQSQPHFAVQIGAFPDLARAEALASQLSNLYQQEFLIAPVEVRGKTSIGFAFWWG